MGCLLRAPAAPMPPDRRAPLLTPPAQSRAEHSESLQAAAGSRFPPLVRAVDIGPGLARAGLPAIRQPVPEEVVQVVDVPDFPDGRLDVVLDAAETNGPSRQQDVARPPVAVAGLAD